LFDTRSGMEYRSVRVRQDRWLSAALRIVARDDPSWGYRLAGGYLRLRGWQLNDKRVFRLWRLNGLSLPPPYRPHRKVRTGDKLEGSARHRNDVWAWDFVHDRYGDAEPLRCLTVKDEATGYCLAIKTGRHLQHRHLKAALREMITLAEARVIIEKWRCRYNERRPHSSQNYITPEMAYFGVREKRKA